ncbi:MAG: hypothetical protein M5R41_01425 [Bacteroidia bacterium]|nr:hypothetical protein [Bacteroidia bacterium]
MRSHTILGFLALSFFVLTITGCEDDHVHPAGDHFEAIGVVLYRGDTAVFSILRGVTGDTLSIASGVTGEDYDVRFYDADERIVEADDDHSTLGWEIGDSSLLEVVQDPGKEGKFEFRLRGKAAGSTTLELQILHEGHADFRSGKIPVRVR